MKKTHYLVVICGPTGVGKTHVAIELARKFSCEILSSDSRQLYRELRIGTAVPEEEELAAVPHHFIHTLSVGDNYNASMYEQEVMAFLEDYFRRRNMILLVGGSGLYIDAVCEGIDDLPSILPEIRKKWLELYAEKGLSYLQEKLQALDPDYYREVDLNNHKRLLKALEVYEQTGKPYSSFLTHTARNRPFTVLKLGLNTDRKALYEGINQRVDDMISRGLVEEARKVLPWRDRTPLKTVGYKEIFQHFDGEMSLEEAIAKIKDHSRAYARRQLTWFRRDPTIKWFEPEQMDEMAEWISENTKS